MRLKIIGESEDDGDQLARKARFLKRHPDVTIDTAYRPLAFRATYPDPRGGAPKVSVRYELKTLLDFLERVLE